MISTVPGFRSRWTTSGFVNGCEALGDLPADVAAEFLRNTLQLSQRVTEGQALHVLHHEEVLSDTV